MYMHKELSRWYIIISHASEECFHRMITSQHVQFLHFLIFSSLTALNSRFIAWIGAFGFKLVTRWASAWVLSTNIPDANEVHPYAQELATIRQWSVLPRFNSFVSF